MPVTIHTEAEHEQAMARIDELWGSAPGTPKGEELKALFLEVEAYERVRYPLITHGEEETTR